MRTGFSRLLFADWADNELNSIILTSRDGDFREVSDFLTFSNNHIEPPVSLGRRLIGLARGEDWAREGLATADEDTLLIPLHLSQRVPVTVETGKETTDVKVNNDTLRRGSVVEDQSIPASTSNFDGGEDDEIDDDENDQDGISAVAMGDGGAGFQPYPLLLSQHTGGLTHGKHLPSYDIIDDSGSHSSGHFFRAAKLAMLTYPVHNRLIQWDEYGEKDDPSVYGLPAEIGDGKTSDRKRRRLDSASANSKSKSIFSPDEMKPL